jgi:hypothetical protein
MPYLGWLAWIAVHLFINYSDLTRAPGVLLNGGRRAGNSVFLDAAVEQ